METYLPLLVVGLIPIIVSTLMYYLDKVILNKLNYWLKQVMLGLVFGAIAILGTEYSVLINDVGMNVRDAAPLCAGLFFGWPAALIAGTIGGIERWIAVYWGAGTLTRLACSLATFFSGVIAALFRKVIFDDKNAKPVYAFAIGVVAETMHMLLVIITNLNNVEMGFRVVQLCTIPMVVAVALSVGITSLGIHLIDKKLKLVTKDRGIDISTHFQKRLLILVTISFLLTNGFCIVLQKNLADDQNEELLLTSLQDSISEVEDTINNHLTLAVESVVEDVEHYQNNDIDITTERLMELAKVYNVHEINLIGDDKIIYASSNVGNIGYDMSNETQSDLYLQVYNDDNSMIFIENSESENYDETAPKEYVVYRNPNGGYVQVSYNSNQLTKSTKETLTLLTHNTRIGETGSMIIAEISTKEIVSDLNDALEGKTLEEIGFDVSGMEGSRYKALVNGVDEYYYIYEHTDNFIVLVMQSTDEADFSEYLSTYLMTFVEISVFAGIFIIVYFLIKNSIVAKVKIINDDLEKITEGDLNVVVNVRDTVEFAKLSDRINMTVNKLKELISEAEKRMENELKYAAEIQRSSLPIDFTDNEIYDIYASMDPAKEVGGDFYDFYTLKDNKLCILIADVSGKGVPASLFMMRAKTQIEAYAEYGFEVNDIFTDSNFNLTEGNDAGLFVTSWIGIIDLKTGHMSYANAGHNPPLIRMPNGDYEYLRDKPGFVLGGMEGVVYKKFETDIPEGASIFIYTDGLTEAQNINKELYGEVRLQNSINKYIGESSMDICNHVKEDVNAFVGDADQFDDMTMLHLNFKKKMR